MNVVIELTEKQKTVLNIIENAKGTEMTIKELSKYVPYARRTIGRILGKLLEYGLLKSYPNLKDTRETIYIRGGV